jgi:hypothetical protein
MKNKMEFIEQDILWFLKSELDWNVVKQRMLFDGAV